MTVFVQGVKIELTAEQIAKIEAAKKQRLRAAKEFYKNEVSGFVKIFKHFGFKKLDTKDWLCKNALAFEHPGMGWFAEILNRGNYCNVFMAGEGLKNSSLGGYVYDYVEEIETEIIKVLENYNGQK